MEHRAGAPAKVRQHLGIGLHLRTRFALRLDHLRERWRPCDPPQYPGALEYILHVRFDDETTLSPPRLVDGDDLMAALGIGPGAVIGELLEAVREAQAAGEIETREQALSLARTRLAERSASAGQ